MDWRIERQGNNVVGLPTGSVDHESSGLFFDHLSAAIDEVAEAGGDLVIDFTDVAFMSSVGLRALTRAQKIGKEKSVAISMACLNETMTEIFRITRFDRLFKVHDSVDAALSA